jgi:hypothetical protein
VGTEVPADGIASKTNIFVLLARLFFPPLPLHHRNEMSQLASRKKRPSRAYYWTMTALNQSDTVTVI